MTTGPKPIDPFEDRHVLHLNDYQVANLAKVLEDINDHCHHYNNGDWVNEIRFKLDELEGVPFDANPIYPHLRNAIGQPKS